jgi:FtsH-binding integral membrane protein
MAARNIMKINMCRKYMRKAKKYKLNNLKMYESVYQLLSYHLWQLSISIWQYSMSNINNDAISVINVAYVAASAGVI